MGSTKASLAARKQWEERQQQLHGCEYIDGICRAHGGERIGPEPKPLCTCCSYPQPHQLEEHDTLPGRFPDDTEQQRFEAAAGTDWRKEEERGVSSTSPEVAEQTLFVQPSFSDPTERAQPENRKSLSLSPEDNRAKQKKIRRDASHKASAS